ncbi:hypothetical protein H9W95_05585 [Flavobacterium lindanitolerans]|nr:hypothetical protein [Flavobacterium lindanitolerans]
MDKKKAKGKLTPIEIQEEEIKISKQEVKIKELELKVQNEESSLIKVRS